MMCILGSMPEHDHWVKFIVIQRIVAVSKLTRTRCSKKSVPQGILEKNFGHLAFGLGNIYILIRLVESFL